MIALPTWHDWLFSAKAFIAAMLALYLSLVLQLPHPGWAMVTAYIVSQPLTGATHAKAVDRIGGVFIGSLAALIIVPLLAATPVLLSLAMALWAGAMLYAASVSRTPRNYVFIVAAIFMPVVALTSMSQPQQIFDIAVARITETLLGILCPRIVFSLFFPMRTHTALKAHIDSWFNNAAAWATESFEPSLAPKPSFRQQQLATCVRVIEHQSDMLPFDIANQKMVQNVRKLHASMSLFSPKFAILSALLATLREHPDGIAKKITQLLVEIAQWMHDEIDEKYDQRYAQFLQQCHYNLSPTDNWLQLLENTTCSQLGEIVRIWHDCRVLQRMIAHEQSKTTRQLHYPHPALRSEARHHDVGLQLFSAGSIAFALFIGCLAWIFTGWEDGANAIVYGFIASAIFSTSDEPTPSIGIFFKAILLSITLSIILIFGVLPLAYNFDTLVLALCIPFLLIGAFIPHQRHGLLALFLVIFSSGFIGLQESYSTDFQSFLNFSISAATGVLAALLWGLTTRPFGAKLIIRRLLDTSWKTLADTAADQHRGDLAHTASRLLDRCNRLIPHLTVSGTGKMVEGLRELSVELNILKLQRYKRRLPQPAYRAVDTVLQSISMHFQHSKNRHHPLASSTRDQLEQAISSTIHGAGKTSQKALNLLVELHVMLFPDASVDMHTNQNPTGVKP